MEKFFAAIRDQHPDFEVVDVRFLAERSAACDQDAGDMDALLAEAVKNATPITAESLV
jgi:hypothetical protein